MAGKVIVFGAGATGRAHVGLLAWQSGFELVFVDKNRALVEALQRAGSYTVRLFGTSCREVEVSAFRAYQAGERSAIAHEVADAALVLTAVFDQNLSDVAQTLAQSFSLCAARGRTTPLNCIACENMVDSSSSLGLHVRQALAASPDRTGTSFGAGHSDRGPCLGVVPASDTLEWCDHHVGFPDCMISRVVPQPEPNPLVMVAEDYNEWTVRREAFVGEKPAALAAMELVDNQAARLERKLFLHNGGHAVCGYLGFQRGHRFIHEAVADPYVAEHVVRAMDEIGSVVARKWGFSVQSIDAYKRDFCRRGAVAELRDEVLRVARDPIRKLAPRERLLGPAELAVGYGLPYDWIAKGIVAALRYRHEGDPQSLQLGRKLEQLGLQRLLKEVCGLDADSPLVTAIEQHWDLRALGTH